MRRACSPLASPNAVASQAWFWRHSGAHHGKATRQTTVEGEVTGHMMMKGKVTRRRREEVVASKQLEAAACCGCGGAGAMRAAMAAVALPPRLVCSACRIVSASVSDCSARWCGGWSLGCQTLGATPKHTANYTSQATTCFTCISTLSVSRDMPTPAPQRQPALYYWNPVTMSQRQMQPRGRARSQRFGLKT